MDKFILVAVKESFGDARVLDMLVNYKKDEHKKLIDGEECTIREYEISENIYKAVRSVLQSELKADWYAHLYSDKQIIILFNKKHFRIDKGSEEIWELMLAYADFQKIPRSYFDGLKEECGWK